jgi:hypothetical protein
MTRISLWIALALALAIAVVTLGPLSVRPTTGAPPDVERGVAYLLFGAAISLVCSRPRILLAGIVLAVAFAGLLEAGQNFVPTRQGTLHDFSVKALALIVGAVAMWVLRRLYRRFGR